MDAANRQIGTRAYFSAGLPHLPPRKYPSGATKLSPGNHNCDQMHSHFPTLGISCFLQKNSNAPEIPATKDDRDLS